MEQFIGIATRGQNLSRDITRWLYQEEPDLICLEYGFRTQPTHPLMKSKSLAQRVENGKAELAIQQKGGRYLVLMDNTCILSKEFNIDAQAAMVYAFGNNKPLFLIDAPFAKTKCSSEIRRSGILCLHKRGYDIMRIEYNLPHIPVPEDENRFMAAAMAAIHQEYSTRAVKSKIPRTLVSIGDITHYRGVNGERTLFDLVDASCRRIYVT